MLFMFIKVFLDISLKLVDPRPQVSKKKTPMSGTLNTSKPIYPQTLGSAEQRNASDGRFTAKRHIALLKSLRAPKMTVDQNI